MGEEIEGGNIGSGNASDILKQQTELRRRLDSLHAELDSERKREERLVTRLKEKSAEFQEMRDELARSERERKLFQRQYAALRESRTWRYTAPARKLVGAVRRVLRSTARRSEPVDSPGPPADHSPPVRKRDGRPRQPLQRQYRARIEGLKIRLRTLGFTERALEDMWELARDGSSPVLQEMAARELALWHANEHSEEGARRCLELLPLVSSAEDNPSVLRQVVIMEAECQRILGNVEAAREAISRVLVAEPHADLFLASANLETSAPAKVEWINGALRLHGIPCLALDYSADQSLLDSLVPGQAHRERIGVSSGMKVSVIMPVYNAESTIRTALDSVLSQTWTNLEVLVVDDCSSDSTLEIVEEYAERDLRVRLMKTETNSGPYVARNLALRVATGEFVTCHDADDWSHPEKIERQVRPLLADPQVVGNTSQQTRAMPNLEFHRRGNFGLYTFTNMSSLMFRREPVMEAVGYWDCVRFGADHEFLRRIELSFGGRSVAKIKTGPLSFQRQDASSLTGNEAFGFHGYYMGARREYFEAQNHYHSPAGNLCYEFPQKSRPFAVPEPMWPVREARENERRHFDVILASDFRLPGGSTASNVEEIKAQKRLGLRTGLVQMSRYDSNPNSRARPEVRGLIDGDRVQMLVYGEKVSCDVLVLRYPPILQEWQRFVPDVEAKDVRVIVNQTPMRGYGDDGELAYAIGRCREHLQKYFGKAGVWHPIGPLVREALLRHHAEELAEITLAGEDWPNIIDVEEWRRESRPPRGPRPRIGRHSRDHRVKWPADREELLAAYPDSEEYEVHVLGGAEVPKKVLGSLPENWRVLEFGKMSPKDFLSTLDVFVYYTRSDWVESFGRVILEAMAAGVPVVLPPSFRELFREAAIYAEPSEVAGHVERLMADDGYYEAQVKVAHAYVEEHFGYTKHAARLRRVACVEDL